MACDNPEDCNDPTYTTPVPVVPFPVAGGSDGAKVVFQKVDNLPKEGEDGTIYLLPKTSSEENDYYEEWIWCLTPSGSSYVWEIIGRTDKIGLAVDSELDQTSENPVQNKTIANALSNIKDSINTINQEIFGLATQLEKYNEGEGV